MTALNGKRILVVEDDYFIASDLKRSLAEHGAEVVGPVGNLDAGLALARGSGLDGAVLDVNLDGGLSYGIADALHAAAVPHLFLTGYDEWSLPEAHRKTPRMGKPFATEAVVAAVRGLFAEGTSR